MKFMKVFVITLLALFLTGCYTQLQYSQSMKKITDKEKNDTPAYSWSGEEQAETSNDTTSEDEAVAENQQEGTEEYIPVYYKDYEFATKYGNVYNFYGNDWYGYNSYPHSRYRSFYSWHPFSYDRWAHHSYYGRWYDRPHYGFSISLSWGWPGYHSFYDPFYDPFYRNYWYRYHSPFAYNYNYFYGRSGYGYGYWSDDKKRDREGVRYGPRSIGTNRVDTDRIRSRTVNGDRSSAVTNKTSTTVRTRSVGTTRTRGTSSGTSVTRKKRTDSSSTSRSRARGQDRIDNSQVDRTDYRSRAGELPLVIDKKQLEQIRSRTNSNRNSLLNRARLNNSRDKNPTFFNRMRNFIQQSAGSISNGNSGGTLRTRSSYPSTNRSKINRSSSSNNRSSVTRSKSSSSNSRSRGSSSSSRSRGGDSNSSGSSDRDRGSN